MAERLVGRKVEPVALAATPLPDALLTQADGPNDDVVENVADLVVTSLGEGVIGGVAVEAEEDSPEKWRRFGWCGLGIHRNARLARAIRRGHKYG
jgi:hypothetical protein